MAEEKERKTKFNKDFCDALISHCKAGYDLQSFGSTIGINKATVYRWIDKYPEFKEAHEIGKEALRMKCLKRLHDFANGDMPRTANVAAAIYLAKVYGIRDDLIEKSDDNKNKIILAYQLTKPEDM